MIHTADGASYNEQVRTKVVRDDTNPACPYVCYNKRHSIYYTRDRRQPDNGLCLVFGHGCFRECTGD